jgi:hypothetical protein
MIPTTTERAIGATVASMQASCLDMLTDARPRRGLFPFGGWTEINCPAAGALLPYLREYAETGWVSVADGVRVQLSDPQPRVSADEMRFSARLDLPQLLDPLEIPGLPIKYVDSRMRTLAHGDALPLPFGSLRMSTRHMLPVVRMDGGSVVVEWPEGHRPTYRMPGLLRVISWTLDAITFSDDHADVSIGGLPGWLEPRLVWMV